MPNRNKSTRLTEKAMMTVCVFSCVLRTQFFYRQRTRLLTRFLLLLTPWIGMLPWSLTANAQSTSVNFRYVKGFAIIVPVFINGSGPFDLLLDTGSTSTAVDRELSEFLQLNPKNKGTVTTLVRTIPASSAIARTVRIGPITASQVVLLVRDFDGLRRLDPALRGVLGEDVLSHTDFLLDYKHRSIQFDSDGEVLRSLSGERIPFSRSRDRNNAGFWLPGVRNTIEDGGAQERALALDSGTASLVLFVDHKLPNFAHPQSEVQDDGGMWRSAGLRMVTLHIRHKTLLIPAQELVLRDPESNLSGLLPTSLFRSLYISNSESFVLFEPTMTHSAGQGRNASVAAASVPHE